MTTPHTYYHMPDAGLLRVSGDDRLDFLQRQTTNDVSLLGPDNHLATVLTNPSARIVDILQLFIESEDTIGAITLPGRGEDTTLFLKRRIFFMDRVTVTDASAETAVIDLEGKESGAVASRLGFAPPAQGELLRTEAAGVPVLATGQAGLGTLRIRLIVPSGRKSDVAAALEGAGAARIERSAYEARRVAAGLPGENAELTEDYTPLEARLEHLISETKGCYTGQEVIARQITYDKITRSLAGVRLDSPVEAGAKVLVDGQNAGTITSYALSPDQHHLALAVLKRPYFEPGTRVVVEHNGDGVAGTVSELPFPEEG